MRIRTRRHRDHDNKPGEQSREDGDLSDQWQGVGVAIPEEGKGVDDDVADVDVPGFDDTVCMWSAGVYSSESTLLGEGSGSRYLLSSGSRWRLRLKPNW